MVIGSPLGPKTFVPPVSASPETREDPDSGPHAYADRHSTHRARFPA